MAASARADAAAAGVCPILVSPVDYIMLLCYFFLITTTKSVERSLRKRASDAEAALAAAEQQVMSITAAVGAI